MLRPTDHEWRNRQPTTAGTTGGGPRDEGAVTQEPRAGTDAASAPPNGDRHGRLPVEGSNPAVGEADHACPVCEFESADADDVYAHLMTAHRKSTISAALLGR